ncbi:MAG TPA: hypothetical protein ENH23_00970 [candidate division Zixibacteria bacterium]|nr:hypothetical protein [candidate division Zixibacteria bacterium]
MSREIAEDFVNLGVFIEEFNLSGIAKNSELLERMKPMHKKLFALMTFVAELEQKNTELKVLSPDGLNYLKESVSDMGQALFCWIQGAYKPANLILRSSIETYVRAIAGQNNKDIFTEKSVYIVFDMAKESSYFNAEMSREFFDSIHSKYKELCKIVHTGSAASMSHISALKTFPIFSTIEAQSVCRDFVIISTGMLSIIYINFFKFIHTMHPHNQNNLFCSIPKSTKRKVNEIKG